jgi:ubiquinone/menaquinone biosynthesis C-methylase UbiE
MDVAAWLRALGLERYDEAFRDNAIEVEILPDLTVLKEQISEGIMRTLSFAGDMARLQRAFTESHDAVVRRGIVLKTLNLRTGERVLELGCGGGYYTHDAARFVGPTGRVCAIDISAS